MCCSACVLTDKTLLGWPLVLSGSFKSLLGGLPGFTLIFPQLILTLKPETWRCVCNLAFLPFFYCWFGDLWYTKLDDLRCVVHESNSLLDHAWLGFMYSSVSLSYLANFNILIEKVAQSCPTLCDPMDCSLPGSSVRGILQARVLEWVALPSSGDIPDRGTEPRSPALQADSLPSEPPGKP